MGLYLLAQLVMFVHGVFTMRARAWVFLGLVALILITAPAVTQQPGGWDGSRGSGGKGGRDGARGPGGYEQGAWGGFGKGSRGGFEGMRGPGGFDPSGSGKSSRGGFEGMRGFGGFDPSGKMSRGSFEGGSRGPGGFSRDPSDMFDRFSNGRDTINLNDIDPMRRGFLERMTQGMGISNGVITRDQFVKQMDQLRSSFSGGRGPSPSGGPPGMGGFGDTSAWSEARFRRYDVNGDGVLNYDEMPDSLKAEREKWDTDRNGLVDLNEYKSYATAVMQQRMQEGGGFPWSGGMGGLYGPDGGSDTPADDEKKPIVYRAGKLPKELPSWFEQFDGDKDGQIGLYEWKKIPGKNFDDFRRYDRNNDGFVTVGEVLRADQLVRADDANGSGPSPGSGTGFMPGSFGGGFGRGPGSGPGGSFGRGSFGGPDMSAGRPERGSFNGNGRGGPPDGYDRSERGSFNGKGKKGKSRGDGPFGGGPDRGGFDRGGRGKDRTGS